MRRRRMVMMVMTRLVECFVWKSYGSIKVNLTGR